MARMYRSALFAALASVSWPVMAMADTGGGGGAPLDVGQALAQLDPELDTDWNKGGQPELERMRALTGNAKLTRAEIATDYPDFDREFSRTNKGKGDGATQAKDAPAAEVTTAQEPPAEKTRQPKGKGTAPVATGNGDGTVTVPKEAWETLLGRIEQLEGRTNATVTTERKVKSPVSWTPRQFVKNVQVVATALGQYQGHLVQPGQEFMFTGRVGRWMAPAGDPNIPLYIAGTEFPPHVVAQDGLVDNSEDDAMMRDELVA